MAVQFSCHDATATFSPENGGRLSSLCVHGHELLVSPETDPMRHGCYPMAPWAGRIRNGVLTWNGTQHQLPRNLPPHAIHGTVFSRPWTQKGNRLSTDLGKHWPWPGRAESTLSIQPGVLHWTLTVFAQQPMPVVLGWHPWFRRHLDNGGPAALQFSADAMMARDGAGITTTRTVDVPPGPWDDCFVGISRPIRLKWPGAIAATVSSDCSHWVIYTEPTHALCVEPQSGPPNAANIGMAHTVVPGTPLQRTMTIRWERD